MACARLENEPRSAMLSGRLLHALQAEKIGMV